MYITLFSINDMTILLMLTYCDIISQINLKGLKVVVNFDFEFKKICFILRRSNTVF